MENNVITMVMGILDNPKCNKLKLNFEKALENLLGQEYTIGVIDYVYSKAEFESSLATRAYNYGIIMEKIGNESVGQGAIRKWMKEYPDTRVFLLMDNGKKGSAKANGLFERDYFDGLFLVDLGRKATATLIKRPRTKEEAYIYYNIEEYEYKEALKRDEQLQKEELKKKEEEQRLLREKEEQENNSPYVTLPSPTKVPINTFGTKLGTLELIEQQLEEEIIEEIEDMEAESSSVENENSEIIVTADEFNLEEDEKKSDDSDALVEEDINNSIDTEVEMNNHLKKSDKELSDEADNQGVTKTEPLKKDNDATKKEKSIIATTAQNEEYHKREKDTSSKKQKKNLFDVNRVGQQINIEERLDDATFLKNYISECTKEAGRDHKENKDYKLIKNIAFINALAEYSYLSEADLDTLVKTGKENFIGFVREQLGKIINESKADKKQKAQAQDMFYDFCFEYDILNALIKDENISDIHVVNYDTIRVKQNGERKTALNAFYSETHYTRFIKNLMLRHEKDFSSKGLSKTYVDKEFSDKFVLTVTIIEASVNNHNIPELIINKGFQNKITLDEMLANKFNLQQAAILLNAIQEQKGILFCGPNKCGATTVMNTLLEYIPKWKSAIVIQHTDELFVKNHPEITVWHPILTGKDGKDKTIDKLCEAALNLDIDYYILGDTKGKEALSLYNALIYGYTPWTTVRASSIKNAFENLENMILDAKPFLDRKSIRDILQSKFEVVVYMEDKKIVDFRAKSASEISKEKSAEETENGEYTASN